MRILIACEFSGTVRDAFLAKGHNAYSCDIIPSESKHPDDDSRHYQCDVMALLKEPWDMIIAHPPCTFMANSGVRWLFGSDEKMNRQRWHNLTEGAKFFNMFQRVDCPKVCIENPIMHKHAKALIDKPQYTQLIQPWQFGHGETKATCLWLKGLPKLKPTDIVEGREQRVWKMSPGPERAKERSKFFTGIADAMASQWSDNLS